MIYSFIFPPVYVIKLLMLSFLSMNVFATLNITIWSNYLSHCSFGFFFNGKLLNVRHLIFVVEIVHVLRENAYNSCDILRQVNCSEFTECIYSINMLYFIYFYMFYFSQRRAHCYETRLHRMTAVRPSGGNYCVGYTVDHDSAHEHDYRILVRLTGQETLRTLTIQRSS